MLPQPPKHHQSHLATGSMSDANNQSQDATPTNLPGSWATRVGHSFRRFSSTICYLRPFDPEDQSHYDTYVDSQSLLVSVASFLHFPPVVVFAFLRTTTRYVLTRPQCIWFNGRPLSGFFCSQVREGSSLVTGGPNMGPDLGAFRLRKPWTRDRFVKIRECQYPIRNQSVHKGIYRGK